MMISLNDSNTTVVKRSLIASLIVLSACACPVVDPLLLPPSVDDAIPSDIDRSEVNRDPDGCYFYTFASALFVVRDRTGAPICITT